MQEKSRENKARKELNEQGYTLQKRENTTDIYQSGCYRIIETATNTVVTGENYDMTLEDVEKFIAE